MKIDRQMFEEVFAGMQKQFIIDSLDFMLGNHPNGYYDITAMSDGKIRPPRQAIQFDVICKVFEKPWKLSSENKILSKYYRLSVTPLDGATSQEIIKLLNEDYRGKKDRV